VQIDADRPAKDFSASRLFAFVLAIFLAVHLLLSLALSGSFSPDDADQLIFSQSFAWGYYEQPPLYSWLSCLFLHLLGLNYISYYLVKSLALGGIYLSCFLCARSLDADRRTVVLAAFSPLLIPTFAWHSFSYLTSSNLACAAAAATCYALLRLRRSGSLVDYVLLGLMLACGFLSKYNFIFVAAGLLIAGLTIPSFRTTLINLRILVSLGIAGLLVLPHIAWLFQHRADLLPIVSQKLSTGAGGLVWGRMIGLLRLFENAVLLLAPAALIGLVFYRYAERIQPMPESHRLLMRFFPAVLALLVGLIMICGATHFHERWLYPFAILLPLYAWARYRLTSRSARRWYGLILLGIAIICAGVRVTQVFVGGFDRGTYPLQMNFRPAAAELRTLVEPGSVIVARDREISGNLRYQLPEALHLCSSHPLYVPKLDNLRGPRVLIWNSINGIVPPPDLRSFAAKTLGVTIPDNAAVRFVDVPARLRGRRLNRLAVLVVAN
jgi:4-amino-4-deoxy-L-arabinose transferase-like glycosyltransferase